MSKLRQHISENLFNIPGWRTKRKIVVIESDDWGSIRMPSKDVYNALLKENIRVDKCPFCSFDSLESEDDLRGLFEVIESVSDIKGNHPVVTANYVVANPDFNKIAESKFNEYYYETFIDTLKNYPNHKNSFLLMKQGISSGIFYPQLHGREHLNINRWMNALRSGSKETLVTFKYKMFGISTDISSESRKSYMAAFDADSIEEIRIQRNIINNAVYLFKEVFGYTPLTFIAPNYIWTSDLEKYIFDHGIFVIQSSRVQYIPKLNTQYIKKRHFTGQKNKLGQIYTLRNCLFEPSIYQTTDWISVCLRQIQTAFNWQKPAIIGTHRVNYIGSIVEKNRTHNLILLYELLKQIVKKWPEVEFLNSMDLAKQIHSS